VSYSLQILERPGYLHFVVTGVNSRETVERYLADIGRECAARGCTHILIEERLAGPRLDTTDVYLVASGQAAAAARTLAAIAYVDVNAEGRLMQFAEDVAVNRAVPVKIFASVAEAERWLVERSA
jgi:type III secretion system FlhB-like substrate exporter